MPSYVLCVTLGHTATGAGLAIVEERVRAFGLDGSIAVWHVQLLETFEPSIPYLAIRQRCEELLRTRSLNEQCALVVEATGSREAAIEVFWRPRVAGLNPRIVWFDDDDAEGRLRAALSRFKVMLQLGQLSFAPGLEGAERVAQELMALPDNATLQGGRAIGALALAVVCGVRYGRHVGEPVALPDDPARDRVRPLDLRPAPPKVLYTVIE